MILNRRDPGGTGTKTARRTDMLRKDIKAGTVYAEVSKYGRPSPVVFLEDGAATVWVQPYSMSSDSSYHACGAAEKPKRERGWSGRSQGYAAARGDAEALEGLDTAAELEAFKMRRAPSREGLRFELVYSLGQVSGPYAQAVTEYEARAAAEEAAREQARAEERDHDARLHAVSAGLSEFGIRSRAATSILGADLLGLDVENAERLLALLREKRES
jgi:hypothetical protein